MQSAADPNTAALAPAARTLRSFVRREGRITPAQQRAFALHWPHYGLDYTGMPRDLDDLFGRRAPRVLEIGFGNGEALALASSNDPARDYLGIEVHRPGVGRLLNQLAAQGNGNVRLWTHDAVEVLRAEIPPRSLAEVRIWFPDPWHKKRHHKRRLLQPGFVELLASRMAAGAILHLTSDWDDYARQMLEVMDAAPGWRNLAGAGQYAPRPQSRPATRFELRGQRLGHRIHDLLHLRLDD